MKRALGVVVSLAVLAALAQGTRAPPDPTEHAFATAEAIAARPCSTRVLGTAKHTFSEAVLLCDLFAGSSLVSVALDHPELAPRAVPLLDRLIAQARSPAARRPFASTGGDDHPNSVLYRGGLLLLLAGRERLRPSGDPRALDALAHELADDLDRSETGWLPTFGDQRWPCDHAPAASALLLHGRLRKDPRTLAAGEKLVARLEAALSQPGGFPTRVLPSGAIAEATPRGTAMAWTGGFLLAGGPPGLARRFAERTVDTFCDRRLGGFACREYPRGVDRPADAASGPILLGYGVASSALALAATRALETADAHRDLLATVRLADARRVIGDTHRRRLENAIYAWGVTARPWD